LKLQGDTMNAIKIDSLTLGIFLVITGGTVAWFHLGKLIQEKTGAKIWYYIPLTLLGGLSLSVGSNLIASGINTILTRK